MDHETMVQSVLDDIDRRIKEPIRADDLARAANYSTYHFCRLFAALTGTPVMGYVTRRKLEHALYDLSRGGKVLDVAMDYGFETTLNTTTTGITDIILTTNCRWISASPFASAKKRNAYPKKRVKSFGKKK